MKHKVTLEEFLCRLKAKWGDAIEYISGYRGMRYKCMFKCKKDGHIWFTLPSTLIRGHGCPECGRKRASEKLITPLEKLIKQVKEVWGDLLEYIGGYTKTKNKCWWKCNVCGNIWKAKPNSILNGEGCPNCKNIKTSKRLTTSLEEILRRIKLIWGNKIIYIKGYKNTATKCVWKCNIDDYIWEAKPNDILQGHGCPLCAHCVPISLEEAIKRIDRISNGTIKIVNPENYKNTSSYLKFICLIDGCTWEAWIYDVFRGISLCPVCRKYSMEKPVIEALNKKNVIFKNNKQLKDCIFDKNPLRPDFYIETKEGILWIECDGIHHHKAIHGEEEFNSLQKRDKFKNEYCKEHGICLIRVTSSPTKKWGTKKHITLTELLYLIETGINSETGEIDFELFRKYDFNRT